MAGFIEGIDRGQLSLLPESLDQWVDDSNPVRVIDAFVEALDLDEEFAGFLRGQIPKSRAPPWENAA